MLLQDPLKIRKSFEKKNGGGSVVRAAADKKIDLCHGQVFFVRKMVRRTITCFWWCRWRKIMVSRREQRVDSQQCFSRVGQEPN